MSKKQVFNSVKCPHGGHRDNYALSVTEAGASMSVSLRSDSVCVAATNDEWWQITPHEPFVSEMTVLIEYAEGVSKRTECPECCHRLFFTTMTPREFECMGCGETYIMPDEEPYVPMAGVPGKGHKLRGREPKKSEDLNGFKEYHDNITDSEENTLLQMVLSSEDIPEWESLSEVNDAIAAKFVERKK
jgi:hypothetical protein